MVKKRHRLQQKTSKASTVQDGSLKDRLVKLVMTESPQCNRVNLQAVLDILLKKNHAERSDFVAKMENTLVGKGPASPSAKVDCIRTKARALGLPLEQPKSSQKGDHVTKDARGSAKPGHAVASKPSGEDGVRTLTQQWVGPDGHPVPVLQSDQISHSAEGVAYLNMAKLGPMLTANLCSPRPMAIVTKGFLSDLQKLEKGKQIMDQYRVCEVSYTYVSSDNKILPARGLLLQFGTGDVKQRETKHDFEVPVDSRVEMTLTLRRDWAEEALWTQTQKATNKRQSMKNLAIELLGDGVITEMPYMGKSSVQDDRIQCIIRVPKAKYWHTLAQSGRLGVVISKTRRDPAEMYDTAIVRLPPGDTHIGTVQSKAKLLGQDYCGIVPWGDKVAVRVRPEAIARARQILNPEDPRFAGGAASLVGNLLFWTSNMPRDVTAETLLKALRDLGWTVGVQRCSARGPRSVAWLLVADVAPPRRELRLKAGYEIFTVTINPAEERSKPNAEKKDKLTSGWNGWNKLLASPAAPATVDPRLFVERKRRLSETLEPLLDPLDEGDDMETKESGALKGDVADLSARLARVEGSIMSVIDSKMQIVQQTLEASVEALMVRVMQQLEAKLSETVKKINIPAASQKTSG